MSHKVSLWIVSALVGALAAMTAAVVVLATNDNDGWSGPRETSQSGTKIPGRCRSWAKSDTHGVTMARPVFFHGRCSPSRPGLLLGCSWHGVRGAGHQHRWSPGGGGQVPPRPDVMTAAPVEAAVAEVAEETAANEAQPAAVEEDARPPDA